MIARGRHVLGLFDARTGAHLAELGDGRQASASFLPDGRVVVSHRQPTGWMLRVLSPDGAAELRRFVLPGVRYLALADPPGPGFLRAVMTKTPQPGGPSEVQVFDLATGTVRSQGIRDFAALQPGFEERHPVALEGKAGVVFYDRLALRPRAVLAAK
jgi:hypothetical protein